MTRPPCFSSNSPPKSGDKLACRTCGVFEECHIEFWTKEHKKIRDMQLEINDLRGKVDEER